MVDGFHKFRFLESRNINIDTILAGPDQNTLQTTSS